MSRDLGSIVQPTLDLEQERKQWQALDEREQKTAREINLARGRLLRRVQELAPHGAFLPFVRSLNVSERTAYNHIAFARDIDGDNPKVAQFATLDDPSDLPTQTAAAKSRPGMFPELKRGWRYVAIDSGSLTAMVLCWSGDEPGAAGIDEIAAGDYAWVAVLNTATMGIAEADMVPLDVVRPTLESLGFHCWNRVKWDCDPSNTLTT